MSVIDKIIELDIFAKGQNEELFVGRPFYLDYEKANILTCDGWKNKVGGISQGAFLLAFYKNDNDDVEEALLLRVLRPSRLPTENDVISSMVEYYKDNLETSGKDTKLDTFTRYEFSFSGVECRILGTFYRDKDNKVKFGSDTENFYSANHYKVYKLKGDILEYIVNLPDAGKLTHNGPEVEKIGVVRYSSSKRYYDLETQSSNVYIKPLDILGRRTALFGMTRTGKSNTVKKIIQIIKSMDSKGDKIKGTDGNNIGKIGQIIFDVNGEYGNTNEQDGTSIYEMYKQDVVRYSVLEKDGFNVMKINFYKNIIGGFNLISSYLKESGENSHYLNDFLSISLEKPDDTLSKGAQIRYGRLLASYKAILHSANFSGGNSERVKFTGNKVINEAVGFNPLEGISLEQTCRWFEKLWEVYNTEPTFKDYPSTHNGEEWANKDLKAAIIILTQIKTPGGQPTVSGYKILRPLIKYHSHSMSESFEDEIVKSLQVGSIIIIDLSQGDDEVKKLYSERITKNIFDTNMGKFIKGEKNNYIQFYFEEAHNLFPKKDDKDLTQIYNRIAKEGAKYKLGLSYATQEVSSISSNILKNTENWFISHLNNKDEIKELNKYYDFEDFSESLIRFSISEDKGFARVKMLSNSFVIPTQIDLFK